VGSEDVAIHPTKPRKLSPVFERENLKRLRESSDILAQAEEVIREAKHQLEHSQELLDSISRRNTR